MTADKGTLACTIIVAFCAAFTLLLDVLYPDSVAEIRWFYRGVCLYFILLTFYLVLCSNEHVSVYLKSRFYDPQSEPDSETPNIIYLHSLKDEEWFEVG